MPVGHLYVTGEVSIQAHSPFINWVIDLLSLPDFMLGAENMQMKMVGFFVCLLVFLQELTF